MAGHWIPVSYNPGLHVRNRYGHEIYKHSQHWLVTGELSKTCFKVLRTFSFNISKRIQHAKHIFNLHLTTQENLDWMDGNNTHRKKIFLPVFDQDITHVQINIEPMETYNSALYGPN